MRLIDADKLKRAIRDDSEIEGLNLARIRMHIHDAPTVEAEPVVHAEWEPHPMIPGFVRCSACRDCVTYDEWPDGQKWKRCPECGAHMDKVAGQGIRR